uniref:Putative calcineurin-like phosphoesterase n=1 Tax=viral metagenome TaxID=1070528 RepID=A0A6M3L645_9ZZZZ
MKLLITGDWHITDKTPVNRLDDFPKTQEDKIDWILQTAIDNDCNGILQPGDIFDSSRASDYLKQFWIEKFRQWEERLTICTVFGNHDLRFHGSNTENTPLMVLHKAEAIIILQDKVMHLDDDIYIYGCSWGQDIPKKQNFSGTHILLIHKMLIDEKLWPGQEAQGAKAFLLNSEFDIIVSGDNHQSFMVDSKDKFLINCGSLMRDSIDQEDHKPHIWIIDTTPLDVKHPKPGQVVRTKIDIPIKPFKEVMNVEKATEQKEKNKELETFIESLKNDVKLEGLDFPQNLEKYMKENELEEQTTAIIKEIMYGS